MAKYTSEQITYFEELLENSQRVADNNEQKFVVQTNIFKCYQNGHQWLNNFHSFWFANKEDALKARDTLRAMGVSANAKTSLGYYVA